MPLILTEDVQEILDEKIKSKSIHNTNLSVGVGDNYDTVLNQIDAAIPSSNQKAGLDASPLAITALNHVVSINEYYTRLPYVTVGNAGSGAQYEGNDETPFIAAVAALSSGGKIIIKGGAYTFNNPVLIGTDSIAIDGVDAVPVITAAGNAFNISSNDCLLQNFHIVGGGITPLTACIVISGNNNILNHLHSNQTTSGLLLNITGDENSNYNFDFNNIDEGAVIISGDFNSLAFCTIDGVTIATRTVYIEGNQNTAAANIFAKGQLKITIPAATQNRLIGNHFDNGLDDFGTLTEAAGNTPREVNTLYLDGLLAYTGSTDKYDTYPFYSNNFTGTQGENLTTRASKLDLSIQRSHQDRNIEVTMKGNYSWTSPNITWSEDIIIFVPEGESPGNATTAFTTVIPAGTLAINDGEYAYVVVSRDANNPTASLVKGTYIPLNVSNQSNFKVFYREGTKLWVRGVPTPIESGSSTLHIRYTSGDTTYHFDTHTGSLDEAYLTGRRYYFGLNTNNDFLTFTDGVLPYISALTNNIEQFRIDEDGYIHARIGVKFGIGSDDSITYDDLTNTFSFNADGGSGNASILIGGASLKFNTELDNDRIEFDKAALDPHFLFTTDDVVRARIYESGDIEAANNLVTLNGAVYAGDVANNDFIEFVDGVSPYFAVKTNNVERLKVGEDGVATAQTDVLTGLATAYDFASSASLNEVNDETKSRKLIKASLTGLDKIVSFQSATLTTSDGSSLGLIQNKQLAVYAGGTINFATGVVTGGGSSFTPYTFINSGYWAKYAIVYKNGGLDIAIPTTEAVSQALAVPPLLSAGSIPLVIVAVQHDGSGNMQAINIIAYSNLTRLDVKEISVPLTVKGINGILPVTVDEVKEIQFEQDSGFLVTDLGSGIVKVEISSHWNKIIVSGQPDLDAIGAATLELIAGSRMALTTTPAAGLDPDKVQFDSTADGGNTVIGAPTDGSYTDGLFSEWSATTTLISDAFDDVNEALKYLAPPQGYTLPTLDGTSGKAFTTSDIAFVTAKIVGDNGNPLTNTYYDVTDVNGGTRTDISNVSAIFNYNTPLIDTGGVDGPVGFRNVDKGILKLFLNGVEIDSVDCATNWNSGTPNPTPWIGAASKLRVLSWSITNSFPLWIDGDARITVTPVSDLRKGWNYFELKHTIGATTTTSYAKEIWWDDVATLPTASLVSLGAIGSTTTKYLSGVQYYNAGAYTAVAAQVDDLYKQTFHANAAPFSSNLSSILGSVSPVTPNPTIVGGAVTPDQWLITGQTMTLQASKRCIVGNSVQITCTPRDPWSNGTPASDSVGNILIDTYADSDTYVGYEYFTGESYRVTSNADFSVNTVAPNWDITQSLVDGGSAGYNDGLQAYNGGLVYPAVDFSTITQPAASPNYSTCTGTRKFYRLFRNTASTYQNFRVKLTGINETDLGVVGTVGKIWVEMCLPSVTKNGGSVFEWKDCLIAFTNEASIGCYAATYGPLDPGEANPEWGLTAGSLSTAGSDYKAGIRISYPQGSSKVITQIQFTWVS